LWDCCKEIVRPYYVCCLDVQYVQIIKVHVSASVVRLLESAEQMELKKTYHDGTLRELCMDDIENYKDSGELYFYSMSPLY